MTIEVVAAPDDAVRDAILAPLVSYNDSAVGSADRRQVAIVVRDDVGAVVGGLWGMIAYRWLFIQYLALPAEMRGCGVGRNLMQAAEREALAEGCVGVWLDTFSFQAQGFYEKLGYAVFGRIDDYPPGAHRMFLSKRIR